jgi:ATP-dependent helicase/DNAse subunit B
MFITYLRSSSYNAYSECQQKYYLNYVLNIPSTSNKRAAIGNCFHKAAEILAQKKLMEQDGVTSYEDDLGTVFLSDITIDFAIESGYNHYVKLEPDWDWNERSDKKELYKWMDQLLNSWFENYSPLTSNIIAPEKKFDFVIEKDWAKYVYNISGEQVVGHLGIKGTSDLVRDLGDGTIEVVDYKTGKTRNDWITGEEKNYKSFCKDPQLLLYYYAMKNTYPDAKDIIMTIIYMEAGGPFSVPIGDLKIPQIEDMLKTRFKEIKENQRPTLNKSWKCAKFCHYGKNIQPGSTDTICKFFADKVRKDGVNKTFENYGDLNKLTSYQDGGGRKAKKSDG